MDPENGAPRETKFNSPLPLLLKLRDLIFGRRKPEPYTQITAYINLLIWLIFLLWHLISFFSISLRDLILREKQVNVEKLIFSRGIELNFEPHDFLRHLLNYQVVSICCWGAIFIGIVLLWRKKRVFAVFIFGGALVYYLTLFFYMGFRYYREDTTLFDKVAFAVLLLNSFFYFIFLKQEKEESSGDFFDLGAD